MVTHKTIAVGPSPNWEDGRGCCGRDGWFCPAIVWVSQLLGGGVSITVGSRRWASISPIIVALSAADARAVADAILEVAKEENPDDSHTD